MKIMFSCIHFPVWSYPPKMMREKKTVFYTGKLYGLTGMRVLHSKWAWPCMYPISLLPGSSLLDLLAYMWWYTADTEIKVPPGWELSKTFFWKFWIGRNTVLEHSEFYFFVCVCVFLLFCFLVVFFILFSRYVTHFHEMSLINLKFGNLRYLHASNLQVLLVILTLKSRFYSKKFGCDMFLKVACVAEAILRKSALKFSLCIE